jgi:hypothetical protein
MRQLLISAVLVTAGFALPWPHPPMDSVHHIGNAWGNYQNYGSPYCHNGQDIMTPALWPAVAIKAGYVKAIFLGGSPMYNGVTVADSAGAAFCSGYMYYHIDNSTIRVQEGDTIAVGDTLGLIATWSVAQFHHNHFSANHNSGIIWSDYGAFYHNPLLDLSPDEDTIVPNFLDAYTGQRFAVCRNNTSSYQNKDSVYGTVDLICRLEDRINHRLWKTAIYRIDYSIRDTFGNYVVPLTRAVQMSDSIDGYTPGQSRAVYKQDGTCNSYCNYDSLNRRYFYIFTNTDGDSIIEPSDSLAGWNTTLSADGDYWVKVIARDEYGNTAIDSMMVKVKNNPTSRHDVGVVSIASPPAAVESGTVVAPACTVYNYGNFSESYDVRMAIGPNYDTVIGVTSHAAGAKLAVVFPDWTVSYPLGFYAVTCSTQLGTDVFPANDMRQDSVEVSPPTGVGDASLPGGSVRFEARPNPARRPVRFHVAAGPGTQPAELRIFDAAGRCVRTLGQSGIWNLESGMSLTWDGCDAQGRMLPGGVYFCRAGGQRDAVELVLLR